ncbi:MFS transporter [Pararobbsia silviterrae]|uniref:MFS transporter n=1 Tax=Pararobbsia silviterrae TaxID=1792498 RepID=UPI0023E7A77C|nr:MFS transporter [Pararobbsia silviterrae]
MPNRAPLLPRTVLIPLIVACALFMEQMDATVIATSLPMIAADLHESPIALKLALTSYLVSLAVFIPISGWMADRFGSRTIFRAAIAVFVGGSVLCGLSGSLGAFVVARFVQGMGGAMMVPVGRTVILRSVSKVELVQALNYLTIPALIGPIVGPPLGGLITTYLHWRWIFFINVPISVVGIWLATRFIDDLRSDAPPPLDWPGFAFSAVGLSATMLGLATAGRHLVSGRASALCIVVGVLALGAYFVHARRATHPLLRLELFKIQTFRIGVLGGSLFRAGIGALPFLLPLFLQLGFGLTPFESGLLTCTAAAGSMCMKTLSRKVLRRFGFRAVLVGNIAFASASLMAIALFSASTPHGAIALTLLIGGVFRSLQFTSLNAISYADIDHTDVSQASSISSAVQQLSLGMGVTIGAFALQASSALQGHTTLVASDFRPAFVFIGVLSLCSLRFLRQLPADAGAEISGRSA